MFPWNCFFSFNFNFIAIYDLLIDPHFICKVLREVLSSSSSKQFDPDFESTRESVLQVRNILETMW